MKRKAKKKAKAKKAAQKYVTVSLYFSREQASAINTIAEWSDRSPDDVVSVLLGVAMFMGRSTMVAVTPQVAPQVAPDGDPPAPAPASDDAAPSPTSQP